MSKSFLKIISAAILFLSVSLCSVTVTKAEPEFDINARAGLLMEYETGTILYEKNIDQPLPIASVTKIMSLCLIFDEVEQGTLKQMCIRDSVHAARSILVAGRYTRPA